MQIRGSKKKKKTVFSRIANIYCVSCHDPFLKKKKRALCVCLKGETQKRAVSVLLLFYFQHEMGFCVWLSSCHNFNLAETVKFCVWPFSLYFKRSKQLQYLPFRIYFCNIMLLIITF